MCLYLQGDKVIISRKVDKEGMGRGTPLKISQQTLPYIRNKPT